MTYSVGYFRSIPGQPTIPAVAAHSFFLDCLTVDQAFEKGLEIFSQPSFPEINFHGPACSVGDYLLVVSCDEPQNPEVKRLAIPGLISMPGLTLSPDETCILMQPDAMAQEQAVWAAASQAYINETYDKTLDGPVPPEVFRSFSQD